MGSLCNSNNQTTQTYTPAGAGTFTDIINRAQQVASTPYTPYNGELVAGVNQQQNTGIAGINAAANQAQPYINTAANYATQGAAAITPGQIANYSSPYQQQVINATMANIGETNAQQQQALKGNAISSGAFGGDRSGIAQAELARQQGLAANQTYAGLNSANYTQALGAAQADRAAQAQGAYTFGNLGTTAQGAALQGAGAQIQAGGLQQGTQQASDTANYQQYLQKLAFPYQQAQFYAGLALPAAGAEGGTQTTTQPTPSLFSQIAGLGVAGLGLAGGLGYKPFAARGGRIGYASGGNIPFSLADAGGLGWIPSIQIQAPQQKQQFQAPKTTQDTGTQPLAGGLQALKSFAPKDMFSSGNMGGMKGIGASAADADPSGMGADGFSLSGIGGLYARGGLIETVHHLRRSLNKNRYADGGDVLSFDDRAAPVEEAIRSGMFDPAGSNYTQFLPQAPVGTVELAGDRAPSIAATQGLPPEILAGHSGASLAAEPDDAMAYSGERSPLAAGTISAEPGAAENAPQEQGFLSRLGASISRPDVSAGLLSAGLGIMSGTSPYGLANIGQGALKGVEAAKQYRAEQATAAERSRKAQIEGQKLAQQLLIHREDLGQKQNQFQNLSAAQKANIEHQDKMLEEQRRQHQMALKTPVTIDYDPRTGNPIMAFPRVNEKGEMEYRLRDGTVVNPFSATPPQAPSPPSPMSALPSSPANAAQPVRTAALETGAMTDAPRPGEGTVQYNTRIAQAGPYDYGADAPYIEKGMDVPEPAPLAGRSVQALKTDAENYLTTSKLPPVVRGNSPVARVQQSYQNAVRNYAGALAQSRGMTPSEVAEGWRTAPGMLRFVLGADGRSTVSLGTAVRHLDTMQQLTDAWEKGSTIGDFRTWNQLTSSVRREFGDAAVTNLQAAAKIIGPEVIKAIGVAGAGGEREREAMETIFAPSSTPGQIKGAIGTLQTLLGGQLEGRERQAANAGVSKDRFKSLIGDRPYELLTHKDKGGANATPAGGGTAAPEGGARVGSKAEYDALPSGATYTNAKDGKTYRKP